MPESEKKKAWMRQNTVQATVKLNKNQDTDILNYYGEKITAADLKVALREYMKNHPNHKEE